mgnify:CR=1 FL=1
MNIKEFFKPNGYKILFVVFSFLAIPFLVFFPGCITVYLEPIFNATYAISSKLGFLGDCDESAFCLLNFGSILVFSIIYSIYPYIIACLTYFIYSIFKRKSIKS